MNRELRIPYFSVRRQRRTLEMSKQQQEYKEDTMCRHVHKAPQASLVAIKPHLCMGLAGHSSSASGQEIPKQKIDTLKVYLPKVYYITYASTSD